MIIEKLVILENFSGIYFLKKLFIVDKDNNQYVSPAEKAIIYG